MTTLSRSDGKKFSDDVAWANDVLKFCISTLKGEIEVSKIDGRIATCLVLKRRLASRGFWWQVKVLDHWIHRAQRGDFGW